MQIFDFFRTAPSKTVYAALLFLSAKILGMIGMVLGSTSGSIRIVGGYILVFALMVLFVAIILASIQMIKERSIQNEENAFEKLLLRKLELEQKIKNMENLI